MPSKLQIIAAIIFSGICWYVSFGLNGYYWYLTWVAPIPILLVAFTSKSTTAFWASFIAYLLGRMSWFGYLVTVTRLVPAIILVLVISLAFALVIIITRRVVLKTDSLLAPFIFPVFFTAYEWLVGNFSPDGSAASLAYTQSGCLPIIQIASLTGHLGVTFMATFIPSCLSVVWHHRRNKKRLLPIAASSLLLITAVLLYGVVRLNQDRPSNALTAGLVVLEEKSHAVDSVNFQVEMEHVKAYARQIEILAHQGAKVIVLPERAININAHIEDSVLSILGQVAKQNDVGIVTGYTNFKNDTTRNSALVIDDLGTVIRDYHKVHLVTKLEDRFTPGRQIGLFQFAQVQAGTAICKDLDFPRYIRNYGQAKTAILCVPAWDFVVDNWLHARMAMMRSVENGFSMIRTARLGRLTLSDSYGKIIAETSSSDGNPASLIGKIPLDHTNTFYTQFGEWFGLLIFGVSVVLIILGFFKKNRPETSA
jgi:apolipoprotein N-acyltransferase